MPLQTVQPSRPRGTSPVKSHYEEIPDGRVAIRRDQLAIVREIHQGALTKLMLAEAKGIDRPGIVTTVAVKTVKGVSL